MSNWLGARCNKNVGGGSRHQLAVAQIARPHPNWLHLALPQLLPNETALRTIYQHVISIIGDPLNDPDLCAGLALLHPLDGASREETRPLAQEVLLPI